MTSTINLLSARLDDVPAQKTVLAKVIELTGRDFSSSREVGEAISYDPALYARVMRLANSAYFGLDGRVHEPRYAVTLLGFNTIRAIAVTAASLDGEPDPEYWHHASLVASCASELAMRARMRVPDLFCSGLLSDLGEALAKEADPALYERLFEGSPRRAERTQRERDLLGGTLLGLTSRVLEAWSFPPEACQALARVEVDDEQGLAVRVLRTARLVADVSTGIEPYTDLEDVSGGLVSVADSPGVLERAEASAECLAESFLNV